MINSISSGTDFVYLNKIVWAYEKVEMCEMVRRDSMKFYTIKLPKFLGGLVRAMIGAFKKNE